MTRVLDFLGTGGSDGTILEPKCAAMGCFFERQSLPNCRSDVGLFLSFSAKPMLEGCSARANNGFNGPRISQSKSTQIVRLNGDCTQARGFLNHAPRDFQNDFPNWVSQSLTNVCGISVCSAAKSSTRSAMSSPCSRHQAFFSMTSRNRQTRRDMSCGARVLPPTRGEATLGSGLN